MAPFGHDWSGALIISQNGVITLNLSALVNAGGSILVTDDTHLLAVDMPKLATVAGDITISGDTSATSVDLGSLDTVAGNVTVNAAPDATVDASGLGPGGGKVVLIGEDTLTTTVAGPRTKADHHPKCGPIADARVRAIRITATILSTAAPEPFSTSQACV